MQNLPLKSATISAATKGAAETLLAKVDMYLKNWQQCDSLTKDVIDSGQYQLMPDYSILWRQAGDNSAKSIFEVETGLYGNADYGIPGYVEFQAPRQDNGMGTPSRPGTIPGFINPPGMMAMGLCPQRQSDGRLRTRRTPGSGYDHQPPRASPPDTLFDGFMVPTMVGVSATYNYKAYHSEILPGTARPKSKSSTAIAAVARRTCISFAMPKYC